MNRFVAQIGEEKFDFTEFADSWRERVEETLQPMFEELKKQGVSQRVAYSVAAFIIQSAAQGMCETCGQVRGEQS